jgi:dihydroxyacetone kinase
VTISYQDVPTNTQPVDYKKATEILNTALEQVIAAEPEITRFDTIVGDGDCGTGLKRGAEGMCLICLDIMN